MSFSSKLDELHLKARHNKWLGYFAVFNRITLAAGFIPSGLQKVIGERFTVLAVNHPMGHYLDAFYQTGDYYTFVGLLQVTAAILLLIPRTTTLGAIIYFPIILNITVLSLAVRFDGSLFSSPLMTLACLYLLCWDYHKLKLIFPFNSSLANKTMPAKNERSSKFPFLFFTGVFVVCALVVLNAAFGYKIYPRNTIEPCQEQCAETDNPEACMKFCDCIHVEGGSLGYCMEMYKEDSD